MDIHDLRSMEPPALKEHILQLRKDLFTLRFSLRQGGGNLKEYREKKKELARSLTVLREKELGLKIPAKVASSFPSREKKVAVSPEEQIPKKEKILEERKEEVSRKEEKKPPAKTKKKEEKFKEEEKGKEKKEKEKKSPLSGLRSLFQKKREESPEEKGGGKEKKSTSSRKKSESKGKE